MKRLLQLFLVLLSLQTFLCEISDTHEMEAADTENKKKEILSAFCEGKSENFCSKTNLKYMHKVLAIERQNSVKEARLKDLENLNENKNNAKIIQKYIDQAKINRFIKFYPRFKIAQDYISNRMF